LGRPFKGLNKIINGNKDIDELHNELVQLKAQIESDAENMDIDEWNDYLKIIFL